MQKKEVIIILYTGNVCSTPFLNSFKRIPGICVPAHEHFDEYFIRKMFPNCGPEKILFEVLSDLYDRKFTQPMSQLGIAEEDIRGLEECPRLVFKWRPFTGNNLKYKTLLKELFIKMNVKPVIIVRQSLLEQAIKVVMTENYYGNRWPQFKAAGLSNEEYKQYIKEQETVVLELTSELLDKVIFEARSFLNKTKNVIGFIDTYFSQMDCKLAVSEDLFNPLFDEERFNEFGSSLLDTPITVQKTAKTEKPKSRKAGLSLKNIQGLDRAINNKTLCELESEYFRLLSSHFVEFRKVCFDKLI